MTAGELDAMVEQNIFGCRPQRKLLGCEYECGCTDAESLEGHNDPERVGKNWSTVYRLRRRSTDQRAAWAVVEAMVARGWIWTARQAAANSPVIVSFKQPSAPDESQPGAMPVGASAPTFPEAVCRAALAALGVEVPA